MSQSISRDIGVLPRFRWMRRRRDPGNSSAITGMVPCVEWMGSCRRTDEHGSILSLTQLCLLSISDNIRMWVRDYDDNYLDHYTFRHIMGPFNTLPGELVQELMSLLCARRKLSRAALHLLLVPQLRILSLKSDPRLVNYNLCGHIAARCQGLWRLDLSEVQKLPSKVLCETLCCLPALRSLSLAGTPCDRGVITTITHHCRLLHYLDVSRCLLLSPAALLPLGVGASLSSSGSSFKPSCHCTATSQSLFPPSCSAPLALGTLLALDIGPGGQKGDSVAAAAFLLLSLPFLEKVAMEGLTQACCLIQHSEFDQTNEFMDREGVPRLGEVWRHRQGRDSWGKKREGAAAADEENKDEERLLWKGCGSESEEDASRDEGPSCCQDQAEEKRQGRVGGGDERVILRLKDVQGLSCDFLDSLSSLCPNIHSLSVNADDCEGARGRSEGSLLAAGLQPWSGQLQSLSLHYSGPLEDLLPALQVAGSSLLSLTLEGVKTSPHTPLLEVIKACPELRDLVICAEPPATRLQLRNEDLWVIRDLPRLPNLCSLTLRFSYEHGQMKPVMSWMSLRKVLKCLLAGSPLLEKLSLVSLPCPLSDVLYDVMHTVASDLHLPADSTGLPPIPLGRVQLIDLSRTDVTMITVKRVIQQSKTLKYVNLSCCWQISDWERSEIQRISKARIDWM
ncbi:uncharacterized protein [Chaetodon trifascialis]|uniref:uncharacterized protein n=1 Tax=Chaetodon trifascialis TaxID=109706 RepID=UPI00399628C4